MKKEEGMDNSFGVSSVTFSILGIVGVLANPFVGIICSIIGLFFGFAQKKRHKNKWSTWGIRLAIAGIIIELVFLIIVIIYAAQFADQLNALSGASYG